MPWTAEQIIAAIVEWADVHHGEPPALADWHPAKARAKGDPVREERARVLVGAGRVPSAMTVIRRFGTWNAALVAAGFAARPAHGGDGNELRRRDLRDVGLLIDEVAA